MAALGIALGAGGAWLVALGGSWYYLIAGVVLALSGGLLWLRSPGALWLFAALLAATLAWSVWEVGLDWWPLAARLDLLVAIGLVLVTPWIIRGLVVPPRERLDQPIGLPTRVWAAWLGLGFVLAVSVALALVAGLRDPSDVAGRLPTASLNAPLDGPALVDTPIPGAPAEGDWTAYGRTGFGQRYSPLRQLTPANVKNLAIAWQYHTGDIRGRPGDPEETTDENTPLKIGNRLFLCTPHQSVIALDATTGAQVWRRDLKNPDGLTLQHLTCRGLSYQAPERPDTVAPSGCANKLFMPTADGRLVALDPATGAACGAFGGGRGEVDLWAHMPNRLPGSYYSTSPVVVTRHLVIVGGTVIDNLSTQEQSGVIRAFDVDTGALVWNWDSGNPDTSAPLPVGEHYVVNSPNSWSISSVDEALGMVYVPMGNQPPDQWGGRRPPAAEKYSSSVVALDLATGRVRWVFQTVHHDLWDYDVPAQPTLLDLTLHGNRVPALVQPTKQGELFVLDRRTGEPLLPVTEEPAPQGAAPGDRSAPTQPRSALSFDPPRLRGSDMWGATLFDQLACRIAFHRLRYDGRFTPPSTQGSLIYPGNFGVFNWGGIAVDPHRQIAFATPTSLAFVSRLVPRPNDTALMVQDDGPPPGKLPALNENFGAPFAIHLGPFLSPLGIPCQAPPWGQVAGADLTTGRIAWKHRNGTVRDLSPVPLPFEMGVPNLGGPILTGSGLAFLSGSMDDYVRAYEVDTGRTLWQSRLPAGGQATPMTYLGADGRQYLLVVAGGHGSTHTKAGDSVIAYALPSR
jgi:quinoprotein glucose dehydrogenase